jgi:hypothetical protein
MLEVKGSNPEGPLQFLADPDCKHILILHEDDHKSNLMQLWYLIHGLTKGEHCVYTTHGTVEDARKILNQLGVDTDYYEKERHLLHITQISALESSEKTADVVNELASKAFEGAHAPFRAVARLFEGELSSTDKQRLCIEVESGAQDAFLHKAPPGSPFSIFSTYQGSMMCHHPVRGVTLEVLSSLISNHDATIFVSKNGHIKLIRTLQSDAS